MISINLHDYREELKKVAIQKLVVKAIAIVIAASILTLGYWQLQQINLDEFKTEIAGLEKQTQALEGQVQVVNQMKKRAKRVQEIIHGIDALRAEQFPVTQILEDLTLSIPDEIWLFSIRQMTMEQIIQSRTPLIFFGDPAKLNPKKKKKKKKGEKDPLEFVRVQGRVFGQYGDKILSEYVDQLRKVPYFKEVFLHRTQYQLAGTFPLRSFTLYIYMPVKKKDK